MKNLIAKASLALTVLLTAGSAMALTTPIPTPGTNNPTDPFAGTGITGNPTVSTIVTSAINVFVGVIGLIAVVYLIVGGLTYIMSAGNQEKVTQAKNTIIYAIVGIVIAIAALSIKNFVADRLGLTIDVSI